MIREIFKQNANEYISRYKPPSEHIKVIRSIRSCRSGDYGHHILTCPDCGEIIILNNSCRNRHCPVCQHKAREKWLDNRKEELLEVPYFHLVFTLPHLLNSLAYKHKKIVFDVLFKSVNRTIEIFANDPKWLGAQAGAIAILHTWGQNLSFHPHIHLVVPAGGLIKDTGEWLNTHPRFFAPVKALSIVFKEIFLKKLTAEFQKQKINYDKIIFLEAQRKKWVVFAQKPFNKPQHVIDYLGNYTHRVAITNYRITKVENGEVYFWYKDYRKNGKRRMMILTEIEFMRRFLQHVLPDNFYKIRYFGFLSNRFRRENILTAKRAIAQNQGKDFTDKSFENKLTEFIKKITSNPYPCPKCGGKMLCVPVFNDSVTNLSLPET